MRIKEFIGSEAIHDNYGLVFVDGAPVRSKAQVNITVLQRGKGWNEETETYEKYFVGSYLQKDGSRSLRWSFTNRDEYGVKDQVHINTLTPKF